MPTNKKYTDYERRKHCPRKNTGDTGKTSMRQFASPIILARFGRGAFHRPWQSPTSTSWLHVCSDFDCFSRIMMRWCANPKSFSQRAKENLNMQNDPSSTSILFFPISHALHPFQPTYWENGISMLMISVTTQKEDLSPFPLLHPAPTSPTAKRKSFYLHLITVLSSSWAVMKIGMK